MAQITRHPSSKRNAKMLLLELLENPPAKLSVTYRSQTGDFVVDCCEDWDNEDVALTIATHQVWFGEILRGDLDDE